MGKQIRLLEHVHVNDLFALDIDAHHPMRTETHKTWMQKQSHEIAGDSRINVHFKLN